MKKFNPLISLVIPVYNGEKYLREAIDSALSQKYKNIEVIVVNDGSTDDTEKIAKSYGSRIRYLKKENGGIASALNLGIKKMRGEYFSWLSHDDVYLPDKIQRQVSFLGKTKNKRIILYADTVFINEKSKIVSKSNLDHKLLDKKPEYAILRAAINGNTLLIPKKAFKEYGLFNELLTCTQDYSKWFEMMQTYKFLHIPEVLAEYRIHSGQDTQKNPKFVTEGDKLWVKMMQETSFKTKERLEGNESNFYKEMCDFLKRTPYRLAQKYADEMFIKVITKQKKKRFSVTFVSHSANKEGAEKAMINVIDDLIAKNTYVYVILPLGGGPLELELKKRKIDYGFEKIRFATKSELDTDENIKAEIAGNSFKIAELLTKIKPDVVVSNTSVINEGALSTKLLGIPHIWFISEFGREEHGIKYLFPEKERLQFIKDYSVLQIFPSQTLRTYYQKRIKLNNTIIIPPISVKEFSEPGKGPNKYFQKQSSLKIALAGNIHEGKGQKDAILAINELEKNKNKEVELVIVGPTSDPDYLKALKKIVKVEKLENYINILPEIKDVPELFREADIVLVCSIFESFGRVTAEAMLASKPLIGANSGATPELIKDGTSGFLYEPGNYRELAEKIEYFIQNKQAVQEFGKVGLKIINGKLKEKDFATIFYNEIRGLKGKKEQLSWQTINMMEEALKVIEQKDKLLDQRQHVINVLSSELSWLKASRIWKARNRLVAARSKLLGNNGNN